MIKILIVDDELDVCRFAKSFFEARGFAVLTASGGKEGLQMFAKHRPDITLIDVKMEGMDGVMLLKEIKKIDKDAETIMVSAIEDMDVIEEARRHGAKEYITKPLVLEELEKTVIEKAKWIQTQKKT
jgi:YesN/AraC family two-component response regulator